MAKNIYCSRKGGATIKGKFFKLPTVTQHWTERVMKHVNNMELREEARKRRVAK